MWSRYGMCLSFPLFKASMTLPNAVKDLLIAMASFSMSPVTCDLFNLSEPAKSQDKILPRVSSLRPHYFDEEDQMAPRAVAVHGCLGHNPPLNSFIQNLFELLAVSHGRSTKPSITTSPLMNIGDTFSKELAVLSLTVARAFVAPAGLATEALTRPPPAPPAGVITEALAR
eukprot:CAMPEP_0206635064 /NCGR_PEP_ID=MMETSP0325_2-20121206/70372_1 /ASSEMBLY_ACC=CAM_ASM_000347 /TAXON_ID=2866 /ORGANISM="Crypthecodinium cohnii, Strain Seligo" /LENGTH=170 /DNA_ID=CAMNT_0054160895 /DNA_START=181 /DNA_END=690 /DNA_ORIENTATION=-